MKYYHLDGYKIGTLHDLSDHQLTEIVDLINKKPGENVFDKRYSGPLGGRRSISRGSVNVFGDVIVKHYRRGGLLRHLVSSYYLSIGKSRPQIEFELLDLVRRAGIHAPEPVAFVTFGGFLYRGWLITKELHFVTTLAQLALDEPEDVHNVMGTLAEEVDLLVKNNIFHVDMHPGNVLVGENGTVSLVDFDKAAAFNGSQKELRKRYLCRWRRAVIKHELPDTLSELMALGLRRSIS